MVIVTAIFITPLKIKLLLSESMCLLSCETEDSLFKVMYHPAELFHYFLIQASGDLSFHYSNMRRTRTRDLSENTITFHFWKIQRLSCTFQNLSIQARSSPSTVCNSCVTILTIGWSCITGPFPGKEIYLILGPFLCTNSGCLSLLNRLLQQKTFLKQICFPSVNVLMSVPYMLMLLSVWELNLLN